MRGGLASLLRSPFLALGATASVPIVVAASEQYGGKQLGSWAALVYANTQWAQQALPAANACLERLTELLTEASQILAGQQSSCDASASTGHASSEDRPSSASVFPQQSDALSSSGCSPTSSPQEAAHRGSRTKASTQRVKEPHGVPAVAQASVSTAHSRRKATHIQTSYPVPALQLAQQHCQAVEHVRQLLAHEHGLSALPAQFTDAEIMRYAVTKGYLRAASAQEQQFALHQAASMAAKTVQWLAAHPFASPQELRAYSHLLYWDGTDAAGHPVLHICIGRAVVECRGAEALVFANAIITQLQHAVDHMLSDRDDARPDRIVVVMDCSRSSTLAAANIAGVFRAVSASLNQHYPGRLHSLVLLDLPPVLNWLVAAVKKLVHPDTRDKVKVARSGSADSSGRAEPWPPHQQADPSGQP